MKSEFWMELSDEQSTKVVGGAGRGGNPGFLQPWFGGLQNGKSNGLLSNGFEVTHNTNADNGDGGAQDINVGVPGIGGTPGRG